MNLPELRDDLLRQLGVESPAQVPAPVLSDIAAAINAGRQTLWDTAGRDYFIQETLKVTFAPAETQAQIPDLQEIFPPFADTTNARQLIPLTTFTQLATYDLLHTPIDATAITPQAVLVRSNASYSEPETSPHWTVTITPPPTQQTTIQALCVRRLTNITVAQLNDPATPLRVPNQHIETLLLPLARYALTASKYFTDPARAAIAEKIKNDTISQITGTPPPQPQPPAQ
jgi:hypothetical protein